MKIDTEEIVAKALKNGWPVADEATVRAIVQHCMVGLDKVVNDKNRINEVSFIDAFMAAANFTRLVVEGIETRQSFTLEEKRALRELMIQAVKRGLMQRLMT